MPEKKIIAVVGATGAQGGGLVRAILADKSGSFAARAITRNPSSEKAQALRAAGAEVVAADADKPETLGQAFAGCLRRLLVTNFWEHFSPERELTQARNMAQAAKAAGVQHVIWSTLEDTRKWVPLEDDRMPTLMGKYKVPHFDAKGEADADLPRARRADHVPADRVLLGQPDLLRDGSPAGAGRDPGDHLPDGRQEAARHRGGRHRQVRLRHLQAGAGNSSARRWGSPAST